MIWMLTFVDEEQKWRLSIKNKTVLDNSIPVECSNLWMKSKSDGCLLNLKQYTIIQIQYDKCIANDKLQSLYDFGF